MRNLFMPRALPWAVAIIALQAMILSVFLIIVLQEKNYYLVRRTISATAQGNALGLMG